jgi:hypothetical protein
LRDENIYFNRAQEVKNRCNKNKAKIMILWGMMDSKARSKDTMDTNLQNTKKQEDKHRTNIAHIRNSPGGPLDMKMNMINIKALDMTKDTTNGWNTDYKQNY